MIRNPTKDFTKLDSNFPLATLFFFFQFRTKFQLPPFRKNIHFSQDVKIFFFNLFSQLIYSKRFTRFTRNNNPSQLSRSI